MFDPLDGSRNIDAGIPTGTIFGVYERPGAGAGVGGGGSDLDAAALQPGTALVAAGYVLYSGATILALATNSGSGSTGSTGSDSTSSGSGSGISSTSSGVAMFDLDPHLGEFVLTRPRVQVPRRGAIYSLNDARQFDWPAGLRRYVDDIRRGKGQNPRQYSARYVCSLVADFHRTLLYGGWCANPRPHLRLVYEGNPLALLCEAAGGRASDGKRRVLGIAPSRLHERLPLFLGSADDIAELESYGDVQQGGGKKYDV